MPKIIHPFTLTESSPLKFSSGTSCSFDNPGSNNMQETDATADSVKDCVERFEQFISNNLSPANADKMVIYSNFRIQDINAVIAQNPDCGFIRIYNCIDADGNHFLMVVPVTQDANGFTKQNTDTNYVKDCCRCKPDCGGGGKGFQ